MTSNKNKVILRYKKEDLEAMQISRGGIFLINTHDPAKHVCQTAYIEADNDELNSVEFYKGDKVLVDYLIGYDQYFYDTSHPAERNNNFLWKDGEGEVRWCNFVIHPDERQQEVGVHYFRDIFGKYTDDSFIPSIGRIFCEVPQMKEEMIGLIWIPDTAKNVDTDKKGFKTIIKYIHPQDAEEMSLQVGDEVWCDKNADIKQKVFNEEVLSIFTERVLGLIEV